MIHQPWGGFQGQASDIEIQAREVMKSREILYQILADHTGKSVEQITKDCDRDYFMTPGEAIEYKIIDNMLEKRIPLSK